MGEFMQGALSVELTCDEARAGAGWPGGVVLAAAWLARVFAALLVRASRAAWDGDVGVRASALGSPF